MPRPASRGALTPGQQAAADALLAGLRDPGAVTVLAGEAGLGKSTLLRSVLDRRIVDPGWVITMDGASATVPSAWEGLCRDGAPPGSGLLVIEDAHQMPAEQLLRMAQLLESLPRDARPRLVFVARPQFWVALSSPGLAALQRAIDTRAVLCRTKHRDTAGYATPLFAPVGASPDAVPRGSAKPHVIGPAPGDPPALPRPYPRGQRLAAWLLAAATLALAAFAAANQGELPASGVAMHAPATPAGALALQDPDGTGPVPSGLADGGLHMPPPDGTAEALMRQGDEMFALKDVAAARRFYEQAARAGSPRAAMLLGSTFDPALVDNDRSDVKAAALWYGIAAALGGRDASARAKIQPAK